MYISANKVNITHSYTPQSGSTSPSTAGLKETSGPPSQAKTETEITKESSDPDRLVYRKQT